VLGKSKAPKCCRSEIGWSQSEWILERFWELCRKEITGCGLWVAAGVGLPGGNNLLEVFQIGSEVGLWIEMVIPLSLSAGGGKVLPN
jgi:hypothetical protein